VTGTGLSVPVTANGSRPPERPVKRAPKRDSGSVTRAMGRLRKEASPVSTLVNGCVASSPMSSRAPVPELPMSRTSSGSTRPPTPRPCRCQRPSAARVTSAPSRRMAAAVRSTSSPSSRPSTTVSPTASAPNMSARWEMDLSPGTRASPAKPPARLAHKGPVELPLIASSFAAVLHAPRAGPLAV